MTLVMVKKKNVESGRFSGPRLIAVFESWLASLKEKKANRPLQSKYVKGVYKLKKIKTNRQSISRTY